MQKLTEDQIAQLSDADKAAYEKVLADVNAIKESLGDNSSKNKREQITNALLLQVSKYALATGAENVDAALVAELEQIVNVIEEAPEEVKAVIFEETTLEDIIEVIPELPIIPDLAVEEVIQAVTDKIIENPDIIDGSGMTDVTDEGDSSTDDSLGSATEDDSNPDDLNSGR